MFQALPGASFIVNGATRPNTLRRPRLAPSFASPTASTMLAKFDGEAPPRINTYAGTGAIRQQLAGSHVGQLSRSLRCRSTGWPDTPCGGSRDSASFATLFLVIIGMFCPGFQNDLPQCCMGANGLTKRNWLSSDNVSSAQKRARRAKGVVSSSELLAFAALIVAVTPAAGAETAGVGLGKRAWTTVRLKIGPRLESHSQADFHWVDLSRGRKA